MKAKKIILILVLVAIVVSGCVLAINVSNKKETNNNENKEKIKVTASNFASYDFVRAITKGTDKINLTFLLGPGKDAHSYDPTAKDLITIQNSDLFIYVGGEMESWSDKVLGTLETDKTKILCISDDVEKIDEKEIDGMEEEEEEEEEEGSFDEHIWTSPKNAISMLNTLEKEIETLDPSNKEIYQKNAKEYASKINEVDNQIKEIINGKKRNRLIFGDKMPMQYFMDYYKLDVSAAFSGCSTETEPSSKTITYLVNLAKEEKIPVILYIELNNGEVAKAIASEVGNGCTAMQIQTIHNLTKDDFENGETWVTLMQRNLNVLKAALQ